VCKFDIPKIPPKNTERKSQKPKAKEPGQKKNAPEKEKQKQKNGPPH